MQGSRVVQTTALSECLEVGGVVLWKYRRVQGLGDRRGRSDKNRRQASYSHHRNLSYHAALQDVHIREAHLAHETIAKDPNITHSSL